MAESFTEQLSRVRLMTGADTWDLSDNDRAALSAVLDSHHDLLRALKNALVELEVNGDSIGAVVDVLESEGRAAIAKSEAKP